MTTYLTFVLITAILSIILTFKVVGIPSRKWFLQWCLGLVMGIAMLIYITLPLMAWSATLTILFWTMTLIQLVLVLKELVKPNLTKMSCNTPIVVKYGHTTAEFTSEPYALALMSHLQHHKIPFQVTGL